MVSSHTVLFVAVSRKAPPLRPATSAHAREFHAVAARHPGRRRAARERLLGAARIAVVGARLIALDPPRRNGAPLRPAARSPRDVPLRFAHDRLAPVGSARVVPHRREHAEIPLRRDRVVARDAVAVGHAPLRPAAHHPLDHAVEAVERPPRILARRPAMLRALAPRRRLRFARTEQRHDDEGRETKTRSEATHRHPARTPPCACNPASSRTCTSGRRAPTSHPTSR